MALVDGMELVGGVESLDSIVLFLLRLMQRLNIVGL